MSERNQSLLIVCGTVCVIGLLRLYFGYESWDMAKDITSILTITTAAGIGVRVAEIVGAK